MNQLLLVRLLRPLRPVVRAVRAGDLASAREAFGDLKLALHREALDLHVAGTSEERETAAFVIGLLGHFQRRLGGIR